MSGVTGLSRTIGHQPATSTNSTSSPSEAKPAAPDQKPSSAASSSPTATTAPVRSTATTASAAAAEVTHAHDVSASMLQVKVGNAQAERETAPLSPTTKVKLSDPQARLDLLRNSSQVNPVSRRARNDGLICGGAAITGALVQTAKTPQQAKANADAMQKTAKDLGVTPTAREQDAIDAMRKGSMSATDAAHLQQLNYRLAQKAGQSEGDPDGVGPKQMGALAAHLKANGAFGDSNVRFNMTDTEIDGTQQKHWTVTTDGQHYNSIHPSEQHRDKGFVLGGPPPSVTERGDAWQAEVNVNNERVVTDFRTEDRRNSSARIDVDVARLRSMGSDKDVKARNDYLMDAQSRLERENGEIKYRPIAE